VGIAPPPPVKKAAKADVDQCGVVLSGAGANIANNIPLLAVEASAKVKIQGLNPNGAGEEGVFFY